MAATIERYEYKATDPTAPTRSYGFGGTPNGVLTEPKGSEFFDDTTGVWYFNTDGSMTWAAKAPTVPGDLTLARRRMIVGNAGGVGAALDGGADQGIPYSDGTDIKRGTIQTSAAQDLVINLPINGAWAADGDGAYTNGGGLVGDVAILATKAASFAQAYNHDNTSYGPLSTTNTDRGAIYAANFQIWPDAEAENDACYFGNAVPFCEVAFNVSATVATYGADSAVWEYWNGAAWAALPAIFDNGATTPATGVRPFTRDGAMTFFPPSDWAFKDVNGQVAYWIRSRVTNAPNITQIPILSDEHAIVTATEGFRLPAASQIITALTLTDGASTVGTTQDKKIVMMDSITGASRTLSWTKGLRRLRLDITDWTLTSAARLEFHVFQEDGVAEPSNVTCSLEITGQSHTHTLA